MKWSSCQSSRMFDVLAWFRMHSANTSRWLLVVMVWQGILPLKLSAEEIRQPVAGHAKESAELAGGVVWSPYQLSGMAMGMSWRGTIWFGEDATVDPAGLQAKLQQELQGLESIFSLYQTDSEISRWNRNKSTQWQEVSYDFALLVQAALQQAEQSEGAFDPTIGAAMEAHELRSIWPTSRRSGAEQIQEIERAAQSIQWRAVEVTVEPPRVRKLRPEIQLDLNALVEGLALERMSLCCQKSGVKGCLLSLGGEYLVDLQKPSVYAGPVAKVKIAIESPTDSSQCLAVVHCSSGCVSTSGTYRQTWPDREKSGQVSHLIEPRTGQPLRASPSLVSVYHENPILADGWATSLMVAGRREGMRLAEKYQLAALFFSADEEIPLVISRAGKDVFVPTEKTLTSSDHSLGAGAAEENLVRGVSALSWIWKLILCSAGVIAMVRFTKFASRRLND